MGLISWRLNIYGGYLCMCKLLRLYNKSDGDELGWGYIIHVTMRVALQLKKHTYVAIWKKNSCMDTILTLLHADG